MKVKYDKNVGHIMAPNFIACFCRGGDAVRRLFVGKKVCSPVKDVAEKTRQNFCRKTWKNLIPGTRATNT